MLKVTAGIIEKDGKFLIAKRKSGKCLDALWEFPGGKLEKGESLEECLKRELREELDIEVKVNKYLCSSCFSCDDKEIELIAYRATFINGDIKLIDHTDVRWILPAEFVNFNFVEPDRVIVKRLLKELSE